MTRDTNEEIGMMYPTAQPLLDALDLNIEKDEFTIIQCFDDGHAIIIEVVNDDTRDVKITIMDTVLMLPKKHGTLDVFE